MRVKFPSIICFFLVAGASLAWAEQFNFQVGPVYINLPQIGDSEKVAIVVELPPGVTPEPSDFRLLVNDKTVATAEELKPFRQLGQGLALLVCVDVSGTMKGDPLKDTKEALLSFIGEARRDDHIALISFADQGKSDSSFGDPRQHLKQAVIDLKTRGKLTRLYQTLYDSLDTFEGAEIPKRRRVIVISDGKDEGSTASAQNVITKSKALRIPIDTVGRGKIPDQYTEGLRGLAKDTGGRFVHARPDRLSLTDAIRRIYGDLLEIRSLVVFFKYNMEESGQTTQNARIELNLPGEAPLSVRIPDKIPLPRVEPPPKPLPPQPPNGWQFWWLIIIVVILGTGLFLWIWYRAAKKTKEDQEPAEVITTKEHDIPPPEPKETPVVTPEPEPRPPMTKVGGYYFPTPEAGRPTAVLLGFEGPVEGQQFKIENEVFHIGANAENELVIAEDDYVSGEHAYIRYQGGSLYIFDKGSRNHTYVNQTKVTDTGFVLSLGDRIGIGKSTLEVVTVSR